MVLTGATVIDATADRRLRGRGISRPGPGGTGDRTVVGAVPEEIIGGAARGVGRKKAGATPEIEGDMINLDTVAHHGEATDGTRIGTTAGAEVTDVLSLGVDPESGRTMKETTVGRAGEEARGAGVHRKVEFA